MLALRTTALISLGPYEADREIDIRISADCGAYEYTLKIGGGEEKSYRFMTAVKSLSRFVLRTGAPRLGPWPGG